MVFKVVSCGGALINCGNMNRREQRDANLEYSCDEERSRNLFVKIEGMTLDECKNGGNFIINYSFAKSLFGNILIASTHKGVCSLVFVEDKVRTLGTLRKSFPHATFRCALDAFQQNALRVFARDQGNLEQIKLHLRGTDFQLKVWRALLKIPVGRLSTYGKIAQQIERPKAVRAVGTAVGNNPVAFLIPCHRVIRATGALGGYHWGGARKRALLEWEALRVKR